MTKETEILNLRSLWPQFSAGGYSRQILQPLSDCLAIAQQLLSNVLNTTADCLPTLADRLPPVFSRLPLKKEVLVLFSFQIGIISILEYIGVISFAVTGAFTAMQKKMDLFGVSVLAFTAACGGGILRDVIMDVGVPVFFSSYTTIALVMLSVLFVFIMPGFFYFRWVFVVLDAIGLSFFAVDAGIKAINQNYTFVQFVFVAVITAVGGGILRDILAQRVPVIFRRDIYALAAFAGVTCMWFIYPVVGEGAAMKLGLASIFLIRIISVYFDINLPVLKAGGDAGKQ